MSEAEVVGLAVVGGMVGWLVVAALGLIVYDVIDSRRSVRKAREDAAAAQADLYWLRRRLAAITDTPLEGPDA